MDSKSAAKQGESKETKPRERLHAVRKYENETPSFGKFQLVGSLGAADTKPVANLNFTFVPPEPKAAGEKAEGSEKK